jgi:hypothetical protein
LVCIQLNVTTISAYPGRYFSHLSLSKDKSIRLPKGGDGHLVLCISVPPIYCFRVRDNIRTTALWAFPSSLHVILILAGSVLVLLIIQGKSNGFFHAVVRLGWQTRC